MPRRRSTLLPHAAERRPATSLSPAELRLDIIREEGLRREIQSGEELRLGSPGAWRMLEEWRIATNRDRSAVNARLTSAGLEPVALAPSLEELSQELQRLERLNAARIATLKRRTRKSGGNTPGTGLAGPPTHGSRGRTR